MALGTLTKVTVTAGVAVRLTETSTKVSTFCIQPLAGDGAYVGANTGKTFIGISTVDATGTTGIQLGWPVAGQTPPAFSLSSGSNNNLFDLRDIYIATSVGGEGVVCLYHTV